MVKDLINLFNNSKAIILPDVFAVRITATNEKDLHRGRIYFEEIFSNLVGGSSTIKSDGSFRNGGGQVEKDQNFLIEINTHNAVGLFAKVGPVLADWLDLNEQEAMWIRINNFVVIANSEQIREAHTKLIKKRVRRENC